MMSKLRREYTGSAHRISPEMQLVLDQMKECSRDNLVPAPCSSFEKVMERERERGKGMWRNEREKTFVDGPLGSLSPRLCV